MKKTKHIIAMVALSCSLFAQGVQAQQWCSSTVSQTWMWRDGGLYLLAGFRGDHLQVCNINETWKGITPATCASWQGMIRSAVARKTSMLFYYAEPTPCASIPTYGNAPSPSYIMMID
jgi:hypothetical protein